MTIGYSASSSFDESVFARLSMALDHLRASIADRRRGLTLVAVMGAEPDLPGVDVEAHTSALIDAQDGAHHR